MLQNASANEEPGDPSATGAEIPLDSSIHALIADHKLMRRIGRGSYGEVWLARHTMGMYRAVKIVHRKSFKDHRPFERELSGIRKFEPISRSHEGFIDILHVGMNDTGDYFYYVMELGDDQSTGPLIDPDRYSPKTLAQALSGHCTLDYKSALQLGLDLSRALVELHRNGLVHRDIKPSNILFVNGVPKLADIGLVSQADEARSYVGTEGFIPPEGPGTAQGDVYALGKVLYEAITAKDRLDYPELPPDWDSRPDHAQFRELNEVILHACSNDPKQRYRTAEDMHANLVVLLAGKSVRRLRSLERQVSRLKRIGAFGALATVAAVAILYTVYRERNLALQMREGQVANLVAHGEMALDSGDLAGALPYFVQATELDKGNERREGHDQIRLSSVINQCPKIVQMWFDTNAAYAVDLAPDGRNVLIIRFLGQAQIFDISTSQPVTPPFGQSWGLRRGTFNSNGKFVATVSEDNTACVWRSRDGSKVCCLNHPSRPLSANFSPDDSQLVTGCTDNLGWVWDLASGTPKMKLVGHTNALLFATFSHDGKLIATSSRDFTVRIWDATTGRQLGEPLPHPDWVDFVAFSPDDHTIATACEDRKARIWNLKTRERILPDLNHDGVVSSVGFSPEGRLIITGCLDGTARIWLAADHQPFTQAPILRHSDRVKHAGFSADGHRVVTGCLDGTVRVWDLAGIALPSELKCDRLSRDKTRYLTFSNRTLQVWDTLSSQPIAPPITPACQILDAMLSADGHFALSLSRLPNETDSIAQLLEVWKVQTGERVGPALLCSNAFQNAVLSNDGRRLLSFHGDSAQLFDVTDGRCVTSWQPVDGSIQSALFNPSGTAVAVWSQQVLAVCDTATGRKLFPPLRHPFPITGVEFSPDGLALITCGADTTLGPCYAQVWSTSSGKPITQQLMHGDGVLCSTFGPNGDYVLTGGEDSKAFIWQLPSGTPRALIKHKAQVMKVAASPDGRSFLTASADKTACVWTTDAGDPLTPPLRHHSGVTDAAFLPDGMHLVTSDMQHRSWIWPLTRDQRPIQDILRLSRLLSGEEVILRSTHVSGRGETLAETWNELRTRYRADREVSNGQLANWYDFQADESELEGNLLASVFYRERLLELRPDDNALRERLAREKTRAHLSN
jgi:WD40 repeat protein